jgi:hypothetical protein
LNGAAEQTRRRIFYIFQYLTRKLLPITRQNMPPAGLRLHIWVSIGANARHCEGVIHEGSAQTKNAVITRTHADHAPRARRPCDDPHALGANTPETRSRPANFSESSISKLSDFLILSVAMRAFSNRAD